MKILNVVFVLVFLGLSACTSYGPKGDGDHGTGYADTKVAEGKYYIKVTGVEYDSKERLEGFWHKRAGELCGENNYEGSPAYKVTRGGYPGFSVTPKVSGEVDCLDRDVALASAPDKYKVDRYATKVKVGSITVGDEVSRRVIDSMNDQLEEQLFQYGMNLTEDGQEYVSIDLVIQKVRVKDAKLAGAIGLFAGTDNIESTLTIYRKGNLIGEYPVETSRLEHNPNSYKLFKKHANDIIETVRANMESRPQS